MGIASLSEDSESREGAPVHTVRLGNPGRFLALSISSNLSLTLSSWAAAHQISWLPFIALSLIGIILGEEISPVTPTSLTARGTG